MSGRGLRCCRRETKFVTLFVVFVLAAGLQNSAAKQQADADGAAAAERGRKEFVQSCGFCHGADATGARGPDLMRSPLVMHDVKGNLIGEVIRQGRPGKSKPARPVCAAQGPPHGRVLPAPLRATAASTGGPK